MTITNNEERSDEQGIADKGKPQTVKQDGFSRPGLAGQDCQSCAERQVQPVDQHDVPDR